ncbi:signal peptidase II [Planctomicrobium sp. SH661]|uniref:signal peptidase II n=1 Tax=Planctomicrobium sp. SH661 TaxID=3448124 RepID=UPI003F5C30B4
MNSPSSPALSRSTRIGVLLTCTIVAVVLDQATKLYASTHWQNKPTLSFFGDIFRIEYAHNYGAFLSLLASTPEHIRFWTLTVINGAVLIGLAAYLIAGRNVTSTSFTPLMLVVAGGLGNLIDRVRFGYVIDFLNLGIGNLRTGIFNVADMFITAGFILMAWYIIRGERTHAATVRADLTTVQKRGPAS